MTHFVDLKACLEVMDLISLFCINLRLLSLTDVALILFLNVNSSESSVMETH